MAGMFANNVVITKAPFTLALLLAQKSQLQSAQHPKSLGFQW